ncbi:MAG: hypothetical protein WCV84_05025 [Patescibacteria group bacterium]
MRNPRCENIHTPDSLAPPSEDVIDFNVSNLERIGKTADRERAAWAYQTLIAFYPAHPHYNTWKQQLQELHN